MSLRIWLPLTKDLRNQGLDDVIVTNNGATFNTVGKLGGSYTGRIDVSSSVIPTILNGSEFTVAFWIYINEVPTSSSVTETYIMACGTSGTRTQFHIAIRQNGAGFAFCFYSDDYTFYNTVADKVKKWMHVVCAFKDNTQIVYVDGAKIGERATAGGLNIAANKVLNIYAAHERLNDVRIYDHCLSPMEVKEISKGLILHYPLNRNGWGQENFILESHKVTSGSQGNGITRTYESDGSIKIVSTSGNGNYASLGFAQNSNTSVGNNMVVGDTYCISCDTKIESGTKLPTLFINSGNGYKQLKPVSGSIVIGKWIRVYYTSTWANPGTNYGNISLHLGFGDAIGTYYFKNFKLEKGSIPTLWCPNSSDILATVMGLNDNVEYDTSGYGNNGTKNNSPTYSSDTVKYNISTHLDGVNQTIQLPNLTTLTPDSIFTFNIWFKRLSAEPSSKPWETILGGPSGFELETCSANNVHDNKVKAYSWGGGTFEFELDKWNMLTMVSNGANALFYLNGNLKLTGTYKALVSGKYFIGSWRDTTSQNYKGYVSDVRIYATALLIEDIKSLYNNSAYIDNQGNIYGAVYEEV